MNKAKNCILTIVLSLFVLIACDTFSQDLHFSQFNMAPILLNPANSGNYNGDWQVSFNYRNQWKSISKPLTTGSLCYDRQFKVYNQNFSGGIGFISDKSGVISLTVNKFILSGAWHKKVDGHLFHTGLQLNWVIKEFSFDEITFPAQYSHDQGFFDSSLPSSEGGLVDNLNYLDVNMGVLWKNTNSKIEPEVGLSFFHLNSPKESFINATNRLLPRMIINSRMNIVSINDNKIVPAGYYTFHNKASELFLGAEYGLGLPDNKYKAKMFYAGLFGRTGIGRSTDAVVLTTALEFQRFKAGISYDINISSLHIATGYKGGFEIAVIYTGASTILRKIAIPCEIF